MDVATSRAVAVAAELERELAGLGSAERADHERRYLKSDLVFHGCSVPQIRDVATRFLRAQPDLDRGQLLALVDASWAEPVHERRGVAVELLTMRADVLEPGDVSVVERLLREARTWAHVDPLAISVAGPLLERHPSATEVLDRWAADGDVWIRRSALLAHLGELRDGRGDFERFARYADAMLDEREFFVRKAIGWVLRDTARRRPDVVAAWLRPRTHRASGVTMREAVKRLPDDEAERLMAAYRDRRPATPEPGADR